MACACTAGISARSGELTCERVSAKVCRPGRGPKGPYKEPFGPVLSSLRRLYLRKALEKVYVQSTDDSKGSITIEKKKTTMITRELETERG